MTILNKALLALVVLASAVAQPVSAQTSTVSDPVGDARFHAPDFQDLVFGQMTRTASGDFELLMVMAGPVPDEPAMQPPAHSEMWWAWGLDLDLTTSPRGYPLPDRIAIGLPGEFVVVVRWDGIEFACTAVDRRPLLTGGDAIITPVPFSIDGTIVEADLSFDLIGDFPPSFAWHPFIWNWAGPVGSGGYSGVDVADHSIFNP